MRRADISRPGLLLALGLAVLLAGCAGTPLGDAPAESPTGESSAESIELVERWTAGSSAIEGNHHAVAAGRVDGEAVVAVPIGGEHGNVGCKLLVLDGDGGERWQAPVPKEACTIHAVADPNLANFTGDSRPELIAATTEEAVVAYDPLSGDVVFRYPLSNYGYTKPVVADVTGDGAAELVVSDVDGELSVVRPDGSTVWSRPLNAYSWSAPAVADFDAQQGAEIVLGLGNGTAIAFTAQGETAWTSTVDGSITWTEYADVDDDPAREFLVATTSGTVAALDGRDGSVEWSRTVERYAAVGPPLKSGGETTVYATDSNGTLYALSAESGETRWTTQLTDADVQMTPPPVVGDVTGDGAPDLFAVTNDGRAMVVDPADGSIRATYERDAAVYTHATLADTDGDGQEEAYVAYGDGTVAALAVQNSTSS